MNVITLHEVVGSSLAWILCVCLADTSVPQVSDLLDRLFSQFDALADAHGVYKVGLRRNGE